MKKRAIISIVLAACLMAAWFPVAAANEDSRMALQLGAECISGGQADNIYYGIYDNKSIKWRVLDTKTNAGGDGLFLLSDELLANDVRFNEAAEDGNDWQGSAAQRWCMDFAGLSGNSVADAFTAVECGAILKVTKNDSPVASNNGSSYRFGASSLRDEKVFFLSAQEATNPAYRFSADTGADPNRVARHIGHPMQGYNGGVMGCWLLRSPGVGEPVTAGVVITEGHLHSYVFNNWGARPAFNLDLSSVSFISAAIGGKVSESGAISKISTYNGKDLKVTLKDTNRAFSVSDTEINCNAGDSISLSYTGAVVGENEYISAIIADSRGTARYYGRVSQPTSASGAVSFTIPESLPKGSYALKMFSEQYNGDCKTDYASDFADVALTIQHSNAKDDFDSDVNNETNTGGSINDGASQKPSSWAEADCSEAVELGLIDEDIRRWHDNCTREEFCRILANGIERITEKSAAELTADLTETVFSDCKNPDVALCSALGIVNGIGNNRFGPERSITREEAATMLSRAAEYLRYKPNGEPKSFADRASFAEWSANAIENVSSIVCGDAPLMQGVSDYVFSPRTAYTIEQAAITILRLTRYNAN